MQQQGGGDPNDPEHQSREATKQNMSTLEQDLKKQILGRSKAEKTFRPWWDTLEDYLLNSLVLLGKITYLNIRMSRWSKVLRLLFK